MRGEREEEDECGEGDCEEQDHGGRKPLVGDGHNHSELGFVLREQDTGKECKQDGHELKGNVDGSVKAGKNEKLFCLIGKV